MKKEILILGIIFLFVGVAIQPVFATEISNIRPSENEEDCNCGIADNFDIVKIRSLLNRAEKLINRVETLTKLIPILSKDDPKFLGVEDFGYNPVNDIKLEELSNDKICDTLLYFYIALDIIINSPWPMFLILAYILLFFVIYLGTIFNCDWVPI